MLFFHIKQVMIIFSIPFNYLATACGKFWEEIVAAEKLI